VRILTWGGLRGGISIALALSLPQALERELIVTVTYIVVIFSVLVQGLTIERVIRAVARKGKSS
jgi:CPA1 family monovalent cation:H+ antiporter